MAPPRFDVYFSGALVAGADPALVRERLATLFKLSPADVDRLFGGTELRIKKDADVDTASRLRATFREAGALIDIRVAAPAPAPLSPPGPATTTPAPSAAAGAWTLAPPRTGSLADVAVVKPPAELPDISWMSLAPPGAPVAEPADVPAVDIDVSHLSMTAPNTGTLEDCRVDEPARPIPDIGHLELADR